ncbi:MAG: hypothetical protein JNM40_20760 [Myxococcales bacterium]|nr:hypothetical protein [Myxococcales bacterium]
MSSGTAALPIAEQSPTLTTADFVDDALLARCRELGLTESTLRALRHGQLSNAQRASATVRSVLAFAALSRGDGDRADELLTSGKPVRSVEERRLWLAASLYRACWLPPSAAASDEIAQLTQALSNVSTVTDVDQPVLSDLAQGCAALAFAEGLLRASDVGAARHQLELVANDDRQPRGLVVVARMLLSAIEVGVGRSDLALGHVQVALHASAGLGSEDRLLRLLLVGLLFAENRRLARAMLDDVIAGRYGAISSEQGTVAHLLRVLRLLAHHCPLTLEHTVELRRDLRWLLRRHASALWSLLIVSLLASALVSADETCEAYDVLVQSAAELRCRRMDGVADLLDRQLATLRGQLGPDGFEPLLREAQRRRRLRASKE